MRFSVIIPVYNVKDYLRECVGSVVFAARRYDAREVEIVCVDDGSTDGSGEILDSCAREAGLDGPAFKVLHKANGGEGSARNAGIAAATGEWMLFSDSDDAVRDTIFIDLSRAIDFAPDIDLVSYAKTAFDTVIEWCPDGDGPVVIDLCSEIPDVMVQRSVCEFAYRRSVFSRLRFGTYRRGADLIYISEVFQTAHRCLWTSRQDYAYRYRSGSAMHSDLSAADMMEIISFTTAMFRMLAASSMRIGRAFAVERGNEWIRTLPKIILGHRRAPEWNRAWEAWLDSMREVAGMPCFRKRQKCVARIVAATRSRAVVRLLCLLPLWFRRKVWRRR